MFNNEHAPVIGAKHYRDGKRRDAYLKGADDRRAAAQEKRDRKAAKRVADATAAEIGQMKAREALP